MELVLDASVVLKWFSTTGEQHLRQARALRAQFGRGELLITVPSLLFLELLNTAARRWRWDHPRLERLATSLNRIGFEVREPSLSAIARWAGRGLTAYDACYVALAEERQAVVITADDNMLAIAGTLARHLQELGAGAQP